MKHTIFLALIAISLLFLIAGCAQQAASGANTPATNQSSISPPSPHPAANATANQSANNSAPTPQLPAANTTGNASAGTNASATGQPAANTTNASAQMQRGTPDAAFEVPVYDSEKAYFGTTMLPDNHDLDRPRIVEVNMLGEVLWEYCLPSDMKQYTNPGFDVEPLANGNVLFTLPRKGVYEINRNGAIVWSYMDSKVSHDADRLPNGNTLISFGASDTQADAQAKEVNPAGQIVWSYHAANYFGSMPAYANISSEGWSHTNAVMRLENGNTVSSHRNFNLLAEVDAQGNVVRTIESSEFEAQHDPAYLPNGNLLFATHTNPQKAVEMAPNGTVVWSFTFPEQHSWPVRDANRLPNGNTLITGSDRIVEATQDGVAVWVFKLTGNVFSSQSDFAAKGFFKAERLEQ